MKDKIAMLKGLIEESKNIVFFGGAGVSTESGIPDFRSKDGLYSLKYQYPPEVILSHSFFLEETEEFFKFYKEKLNCLDVKPNITHYALTKLEEMGKLSAVITQNIDGLHTKAGSKNVIELHGSVHRNYCMSCRRFYDATKIFESNGIPMCECGGVIKPDVVLYEESVQRLGEAKKAITNCDLLIVAGTSLNVYPAAGLINYCNGGHIVIINKDATEFDNQVELVINESLGKVFEQVMED